MPTRIPNLAGLGAIQPDRGLAALLAVLGGGSEPAVLTASPLYWANLLRTQPSTLFDGFAPLAALDSEPAAAPASGKQDSKAAAARTVPRVSAPAVDRTAEVLPRVLAIAAEVLGTAVDPQQSLMEVSWP